MTPICEPELPENLMFNQWCVVGAFNLIQQDPASQWYGTDGSPVMLDETVPPFYPFGADERGIPKRVRCRTVIMYQTTGNPNAFDPTDDTFSMPTGVVIFVKKPNSTVCRNIYPHRGWGIEVYPTKTSRDSTRYRSAGRASIFTQHIEFRCVPI